MQTNFKKDQLLDPEIQNSEKFLENVFIVECATQLVQLIKY